MRKLNEEKFFADFDAVVAEKEAKIATKEEAVKVEIEKAERVCVENGYSDAIKSVLTAEAVAEKEKEFDVTDLEEKIAEFNKYIEIVEDVVEETIEDVENVEETENSTEVEETVTIIG